MCIRDRVCDEFWLVTRGGVSTFDGDLDDYQKWLQEQAREVALAARAAREAGKANAHSGASADMGATANGATNVDSGGNRKEDRKAAAQARQRIAEQAKPLKTELKQIETRLAQAQAEQARLGESLAQPGLSGSERADQGKRLKALEDEVEALEMRWLEVTEAVEQLSA